jgi:hypothetical protein
MLFSSERARERALNSYPFAVLNAGSTIGAQKNYIIKKEHHATLSCGPFV